MRKTTKKRQNKKNKTRFRLKGGASYSGRILPGAMTEYPYCDIFVHTFRSILYSIFSKSAYNAYEFSSAFDDWRFSFCFADLMLHNLQVHFVRFPGAMVFAGSHQAPNPLA